MKIPFSKEAFLEVFRQYNLAVWPAQFILVGIGLVCVYVVFLRKPIAGKVVFLTLCFLWLWMGVVYHAILFSAINPAAYLFGFLFVIQASMFFHFGISRQALEFDSGHGWEKWAAIIILTYSLFIYPLLGFVFGHGYPNGPTFGVPCPTTIFTFGILLLAAGRLPWWIIVIPLFWSVIGFFAALNLGMPEDYGLLPSGIVYLYSRKGQPQLAAS